MARQYFQAQYEADQAEQTAGRCNFVLRLKILSNHGRPRKPCFMIEN